ncbi:hypothetical protein GCM10023144_08780 [Pigmentiphaga soli]|uniref:Ferritin-like domain-containing protein n=1 Tax=Pigmentiphaga soli TaxID=1007095 RepID=A0ABP8GK87_9BURK
MEDESKLGMNHTGMQMAPIEGPRAVAFAREMPVDVLAGRDAFAMERTAYIEVADRIGSVPVPGTVKGMMQTALGKITGKAPEVLVDKLGQRLAFERTGTRLYEALITKVEAAELGRTKDMCRDLHRICSEEGQHVLLLKRAMESIGADPTAQTPCADTSAVASMGILQVITDPRTTINQCLDAILTAELTDNAGWELLIAVARQTGHGAMADSFDAALEEESEHLAMVRNWLASRVLEEAT